MQANPSYAGKPMKKSKFSLNRNDQALSALVQSSNKRTLALWPIECVERVLSFFTRDDPEDNRPQQALDTLRNWLDTGKFSMSVIRTASLNSHAAAHEIEVDSPARSAARAAGQAVATAHVPAHALAAASYAQQAGHRAADPDKSESAVAEEARWQYQRLIELNAGKKD